MLQRFPRSMVSLLRMTKMGSSMDVGFSSESVMPLVKLLPYYDYHEDREQSYLVKFGLTEYL